MKNVKCKIKIKNFKIWNLKFGIHSSGVKTRMNGRMLPKGISPKPRPNTNDWCGARVSTRGAGFTLLEVMIALAIAGGLLVTLIYTLNYHLSIAERHEIVTIASMLAKGKMAEIEKDPAETKGEFPEPYSDYHYVTAVRETPYIGISEIYVTVSNGNEKVKFSELIQSTK